MHKSEKRLKEMHKRSYSKTAKIILLIPLITVAVVGVSVIAALYTKCDILYDVASIGLLVAPLPCLILSVIGIFYVYRAVRNGEAKAKKKLLGGVCAIIGSLGLLFLLFWIIKL